MIDQTKDKKDELLSEKLENVKKAGANPKQAQQQVQIAKEKAELSKDQKSGDKLKEQSGNNMSKGMQPIGIARVLNDKAAVHSEPEKQGAKISELSKARQIDILAVQGSELKILVDGKVGYVDANMTDYAGVQQVAEKKAPTPQGSVKVTAAALRVRTAPDKESNYIGTLRQADNVNIYGEKDGFLEVHIGDQIGYISAAHTDYDGAQKSQNLQPAQNNALEQAPAELQDLLAKESLNTTEITTAKSLIARCPETIQGDLNEALQAKAVKKDDNDNAESADGKDYQALAECLKLQGIRNPQTDKSYAAYLAQLQRSQKLPENGGMQNWGSLANAMGVSYNTLMQPGDRAASEKKFWSEMAREQLRQGHSVMACVNGQTVRVEAIEEKGLVLTLPNNTQIPLETYSGQAEQKAQGTRGLLAFDKLSDVDLQWVITLG